MVDSEVVPIGFAVGICCVGRYSNSHTYLAPTYFKTKYCMPVRIA